MTNKQAFLRELNGLVRVARSASVYYVTEEDFQLVLDYQEEAQVYYRKAKAVHEKIKRAERLDDKIRLSRERDALRKKGDEWMAKSREVGRNSQLKEL